MSIHRFLKRNSIRPRQYFTPQDFLADVIEYFEWVDDNPLQEEKVFHHQGAIVRTDVGKMRAYTKQGLATYLGIPVSRFDSYKTRQDPGW